MKLIDKLRSFSKYGKQKMTWDSPIICEGCNKEVESISRNPLLGQNKWLCQECQNKIEGDKIN